MKTVALCGPKGAGRVALVDDEDYDLVMQFKWYLRVEPSGIAYATTCVGRRNRRNFRMHKLITGWPETDHEDHNGLNNQRSNLRPVTRVQNNQNQRAVRGGSSQYKGACWDRGKWVASIWIDGRSRHLGRFASEEDAARAYDTAAREAFGEYACLNFPDAA